VTHSTLVNYVSWDAKVEERERREFTFDPYRVYPIPRWLVLCPLINLHLLVLHAHIRIVKYRDRQEREGESLPAGWSRICLNDCSFCCESVWLIACCRVADIVWSEWEWEWIVRDQQFVDDDAATLSLSLFLSFLVLTLFCFEYSQTTHSNVYLNREETRDCSWSRYSFTHSKPRLTSTSLHPERTQSRI